MLHHLVLRDHSTPANFLSTLLALDGPSGNFEKPIVQRTRVHVGQRRMPETRALRHVGNVRYFRLRDEDAVCDPAGVGDLVVWESMLSDDRPQTVRADNHVEWTLSRPVLESEIGLRPRVINADEPLVKPDRSFRYLG
jgi:hypothetical protein